MLKSTNFLAAIVPIFSLLIVCHQVYRVNTCNQSTWKGGGFGMFSSSDGPSMRHVRLGVQVDGLKKEIPPPVIAVDLQHNLVTAPNDKTIKAYAEVLVNYHWGTTERDGIAASETGYWGPHIKDGTLESLKIGTILSKLDRHTGKISTSQFNGLTWKMNEAPQIQNRRQK